MMGDERAHKVSLVLGCSALAVSLASAAGVWVRRRRLINDAVSTYNALFCTSWLVAWPFVLMHGIALALGD